MTCVKSLDGWSQRRKREEENKKTDVIHVSIISNRNGNWTQCESFSKRINQRPRLWLAKYLPSVKNTENMLGEEEVNNVSS